MSIVKKKSFMGAPIKKSSRLVHAPSKAKAITAFVILALGVALMPSGFMLANLIQTESRWSARKAVYNGEIQNYDCKSRGQLNFS